MFLKKATLTWLLVAFVAMGAIGGALYVGYRLGQQDPKIITVKGITNLEDPDIKADFGLFWQVWEKLREYHIKGGETPDKELVYGAVGGLVNALKISSRNSCSSAFAESFTTIVISTIRVICHDASTITIPITVLVRISLPFFTLS